MSFLFKDKSGNYCASFLQSLEALKYNGKKISPRGQNTLELEHVVFEIDPTKCLFLSPTRKMSIYFLVAENIWYWSGRNSTCFPSSYIKSYENYSNDKIHQGAYGPMLLEQIRYVVDSLKEDNDTRQAVITLWRPNPNKSRDIPCTISFDFKIREGKLNLHVTMRSNDAIFGNNYDIPSFSLIQIVIASILGVDTGKLFLTAHSFHIYEKHYNMLDSLLLEGFCKNNYPNSLVFQKNKTISLSDHIGLIEKLLCFNYFLDYSFRKYSNVVPDFMFDKDIFENQFYYQFALIMEHFYFNKVANFNSNELSILNNDLLLKLKNIGSPFGSYLL